MEWTGRQLRAEQQRFAKRGGLLLLVGSASPERHALDLADLREFVFEDHVGDLVGGVTNAAARRPERVTSAILKCSTGEIVGVAAGLRSHSLHSELHFAAMVAAPCFTAFFDRDRGDGSVPAAGVRADDLVHNACAQEQQ